MKNKPPSWLRQFSIDSGLDTSKTLSRTVYEQESIDPDPRIGLRGGWELTGRVTYFVKDDVNEFEITVERIAGPRDA